MTQDMRHIGHKSILVVADKDACQGDSGGPLMAETRLSTRSQKRYGWIGKSGDAILASVDRIGTSQGLGSTYIYVYLLCLFKSIHKWQFYIGASFLPLNPRY